jgi:stress-induced morphogen
MAISTTDALREHIVAALPDAQVTVTTGSAGHYTLEVVSTAFAGKTMLQSQRLVMAAIAPLLKGEGAPVHAIDRLVTQTP